MKTEKRCRHDWSKPFKSKGMKLLEPTVKNWVQCFKCCEMKPAK